ncbi:hypothetical protein [Chitinilyticum piscinae]|uniref:Uncharacterized protein n=1 Tax=Chitinilyticum piscinae TaxID=2866724 RepID=A0A8J7FQJ9_9NEIS|nr:hypothetical protein [Chitinilyticum piscinae]MBE9608886.1 hypothetical protein [Chitinilyticum piscinae]
MALGTSKQAWFKVVQLAVTASRSLAWQGQRAQSEEERLYCLEQIADLQDAIHVIVELLPEWERCDEKALRATFLEAYDQRWGHVPPGSLCEELDRHSPPK